MLLLQLPDQSPARQAATWACAGCRCYQPVRRVEKASVKEGDRLLPHRHTDDSLEAAQEQLQALLQREGRLAAEAGWLEGRPRLADARAKLLRWLRLAALYHRYSIVRHSPGAAGSVAGPGA